MWVVAACAATLRVTGQAPHTDREGHKRLEAREKGVDMRFPAPLSRIVVFGAAAIALPLHVDAQDAPAPPRVADSVRVALSLSGGISYGSYQAGLNYALVDLIKRRDLARLDFLPAHRAAQLPSEMSIAAATGASAGNVNALISALEWCRTDLPSPEESLYWSTWVNVGVTQLLPQVPYGVEGNTTVSEDGAVAVGDSAIFHRRFFKAVPYVGIAERMARSDQLRPGECDVPVGISLTRLNPGYLLLGAPGGDSLPVATQRYITVFQAEKNGDHLAFSQPDEAFFNADPSIGKWLVLEDSVSVGPQTVNGSSELDLETVLASVEAASAYPIAFPPVELAFFSDDSVCRRLSLCRTQFLDGGLFDNNPLAVALSILRHRYGVEEADRRKIVYIDPGRRRERIEPEEAAVEPEASLGLGAAAQMIRGGIPAARQYELQSLARFLPPAEQAGLSVTDRAYPVYGETLNAFGAFLGRPLREHDFFVGVFDGFYFFAREFVCSRESATGLYVKFNEREECIEESVRALVEGHPELSPAGRAVVDAAFEHEFNARPTARRMEDVSQVELNRLRLQRGLLAADTAFLLPEDSIACESDDVFHKLACGQRLEEAAHRFPDSVRSLADSIARLPTCSVDSIAVRAIPAECLAEPDFVQLMRHPPDYLAGLTLKILRQLWRVQNAYDPAETSGIENIVEIAEIYYRSVIYPRYQRGVANPVGTVPSSGTGTWVAQFLVPYEVSALSQANGYRLQGMWRPITWHVNADIALGFSGGMQYGFGAARGFQYEVRTGLYKKIPNAFLTALEVSGLGVYHCGPVTLPWNCGAGAEWRPGVSLGVHIIGGKLRVAPRWIFGGSNSGLDPAQVSLGFSDVGGLIYWTTRLGVWNALKFW